MNRCIGVSSSSGSALIAIMRRYACYCVALCYCGTVQGIFSNLYLYRYLHMSLCNVYIVNPIAPAVPPEGRYIQCYSYVQPEDTVGVIGLSRVSLVQLLTND